MKITKIGRNLDSLSLVMMNLVQLLVLALCAVIYNILNGNKQGWLVGKKPKVYIQTKYKIKVVYMVNINYQDLHI